MVHARKRLYALLVEVVELMIVKYGYWPESEQPQEQEEDVWVMVTEPEQHYVHIFYEDASDVNLIKKVYETCDKHREIYIVRRGQGCIVYFSTVGSLKWFEFMHGLNAWM